MKGGVWMNNNIFKNSIEQNRVKQYMQSAQSNSLSNSSSDTTNITEQLRKQRAKQYVNSAQAYNQNNLNF